MGTSAIFGREKELAIIRDFIQNYKKQKKPCLLLFGPCGSGKTSAIYFVANELNQEVLEINASDARNKDNMLSVVLPAMQTQSFFHTGKVILLDEIDGISGNADRGGVAALAAIVTESKYPVILTANETEIDKLKPIIKQSLTLGFEKLNTNIIEQILQSAATQKKITIDAQALGSLARQSDGDARAALNDLGLLAIHQTITKEHVKLLSERKRTESITQALTTIFKTTDANLALESTNNIDEDIDEQIMWLDYNIPLEYTNPIDLARAYGALSKADVFRRRIRRQQEWGMLAYIHALITAGVSTAKDKPYAKVTPYQRSMRPLKIWQVNMANAKRKVIAQKIAEHTHTSDKRAFIDIEFYKQMCRNKTFAEKLSKQLDLSEDEQEWLVGI